MNKYLIVLFFSLFLYQRYGEIIDGIFCIVIISLVTLVDRDFKKKLLKLDGLKYYIILSICFLILYYWSRVFLQIGLYKIESLNSSLEFNVDATLTSLIMIIYIVKIKDRKEIDKIISVIIKILVVLLSISYIVKLLNGNDWLSAARYFEYKNHQALYMAIVFILYMRERISYITIIGMILAMFFSLTMNSKAVAMLVIISAFVFYTSRKTNFSFNKINIYFIISVIISSFILNYKMLGSPYREFIRETNLQIVINESMLFGKGPGNYSTISTKYKESKLATTSISSSAHNDYIEFFIESGWFGIIIIMYPSIVILNLVLKKTRRKLYKMELAKSVIILVITHSFFDSNRYNHSLMILSLLLIVYLYLVNKNLNISGHSIK